MLSLQNISVLRLKMRGAINLNWAGEQYPKFLPTGLGLRNGDDLRREFKRTAMSWLLHSVNNSHLQQDAMTVSARIVGGRTAAERHTNGRCTASLRNFLTGAVTFVIHPLWRSEFGRDSRQSHESGAASDQLPSSSTNWLARLLATAVC